MPEMCLNPFIHCVVPLSDDIVREPGQPAIIFWLLINFMPKGVVFPISFLLSYVGLELLCMGLERVLAGCVQTSLLAALAAG